MLRAGLGQKPIGLGQTFLGGVQNLHEECEIFDAYFGVWLEGEVNRRQKGSIATQDKGNGEGNQNQIKG